MPKKSKGMKYPKKFKFFLTAKGQTDELLNAPDNWNQTTVEFKRSTSYMGVIRSLSIPFNFVFKGAGIIRNVFYSDFLMGNCKLLIQKLNTLTYEYISIFSGKIDMTTIEDNKSYITASVIEDSFSEKVAAYDKVKYEIPLDIPEVVQVRLTAIPFKEKADFIMVPYSGFQPQAYPGLNLINNEQHAINPSVKQVDFKIISTPNFAGDNNYFYNATTNTQVTIEITNFAGFVQTSDEGYDRNFDIQLVNQNGVVLKTLYHYFTGEAFNTQPFLINETFTLSVSKTDTIFLYTKLTDGHDNDSGGFYIGAGSMTLNYNTESPESMCNALRASFVFDYLVQKMNGLGTGGAYIRQETRSTLLTTILQRVVITCSNSIRKITDGQQYDPGDSLIPGAKYLVTNGTIIYNSINYPINSEFIAIDGVDTFVTNDDGTVVLIGYKETIVLSFEDFFQSVKSWMGGNAGYGLDAGIAVLEEITYFFRNLATLDLGTSINGLTVSPSLDNVYNSLKIGGEDQQYDTLNGFQETNSTQYYTGDLTALQKELDCVSPIRIDPYGIETLRFTPADTSASRSDNDVWAIWLKEDFEIGHPWYQPLRGEELTSITGVDAGVKYYNWRLTPKQSLLRGATYLASVFASQTTLRFTTALKNPNLVTVDTTGRRVAERDNVLISDLGTPAFYPMLFKFNCALSADALNQMNIMYTAIKFKWRGNDFAGFIMETSVDAGANSQRDFTLISVPNNNFQKQIR